MKQTAYLTIRLEIEDGKDINPVHICDELSIRDNITGYKFRYDNYIPYKYNNCIETFIPNFHD